MNRVPPSKRYAYGTAVPIRNSRSEIEKTLERFGASGFAFMQEGRRAMVMFQVRDRRIRFDIPAPDDKEFGREAPGNQSRRDAEERRLWRSLAMAVKAKLDIIESGISSFDEEFLAYTVVDGTTETFFEHSKRPEVAAMLSNKAPIIALSGGKG